ncbi:PilW family protein [Denitratimonas tolerans]|jgi:type IV pilus assembly protein PilW|uniref:Prepilin-type N-terminal cleavage/methylation domain-containing protein n=1 Tax=Denitratimonas tolerans TaxID=1338420 RepID=A0AAW9R7P4_9GAMM|nr:prepilin-type N-terminal cleavage/methylation domain-containing protein [Rhodocyclaceae bacterium]HRQ66805.1 prepilin-type N-terminal cleavage/methylation domain-containing protein [Xanthomonadaceae bacterium]
MSISFSAMRAHRPQHSGFTLVEVLVAVALGLLLMAGIITLFSGISGTNKVQSGLARLQENGRFALMRMETDMRMAAGQYCSSTTGASVKGTTVPVLPSRAPMVYARDLNLPDSNINSIDATGNPTTASAAAAYVLSPRWFIQGYTCTTTACTPALTAANTGIPDMGLAVGSRVPGSDVLTVRYLRGSGWTVPLNTCSTPTGGTIAGGTVITVAPQTGDDPFNMTAGLALVSDCIAPAILPISAVNVGSKTLTVDGNVLAGAPGQLCNGSSLRDARLFDFTNDFVTVSYYLVFRGDDSPDARPNSAASQRLIPVLVRSENGVAQELVRGVDLLAFRFGVLQGDGNTRLMTAAEITTTSPVGCAVAPPGTTMEPGCLWRSVRTIEPHLLVNSVDEVNTIDAIGRSYRFDGTDYPIPAASDTLPSGLQVGNMNRREFIGYFSVRNGNL